MSVDLRNPTMRAWASFTDNERREFLKHRSQMQRLSARDQWDRINDVEFMEWVSIYRVILPDTVPVTIKLPRAQAEALQNVLNAGGKVGVLVITDSAGKIGVVGNDGVVEMEDPDKQCHTCNYLNGVLCGRPAGTCNKHSRWANTYPSRAERRYEGNQI